MEQRGKYGETLQLAEEKYSGLPQEIWFVLFRSSVLSAAEMFI